MIEVEVKLQIKNREQLIGRLLGLSFEEAEGLYEEDIYFDDREGSIRKNGQALRVRLVENVNTGGSDTVITFKGEKLDQVSMSREEIELGVLDFETAIHLLESLGYFPVAPRVMKRRQEYVHRFREDAFKSEMSFSKITACVDQVEGLGDFLELEILVEEAPSGDAATSGQTAASGQAESSQTAQDKAEALKEIETILYALGYSFQDTTRNSYLSMLQGEEDA